MVERACPARKNIFRLERPVCLGMTIDARRLQLAFMLLAFGAMSLFASASHASERIRIEASQSHTPGKIFLRAELSKPEGEGPFPAVILMHGCGGWQPAVRYTMHSYADYMVSHGFAVLNLDSFGPRRYSGGKVCESFKRLKDARSYRSYDAFDAMRYLKALDFIDPNNIFLMGQSNGGSVAINVAKASDAQAYNRSGDSFRAVVAYYPWCGAFGSRNVELASPLLIFGGERDDWVPPHACQDVNAKGADLKVKIYPQAPHSFDLEIMQQRYLGKLIGKDSYAAEDSRERMLAFFSDHLTPDLKSKRISSVQSSDNQTIVR